MKLRRHLITSEIGITFWEVLNNEPELNESDSSMQLHNFDDSEIVEDETYNIVDNSITSMQELEVPIKFIF